MRTLRTLLLTCLTIALSFGAVSAQGVSEYMPYQGFLADSTGAPVDGFYDLTFKLYETSNSPDALWEESIPQVQVSSGAFSVNLGGVTPEMKSYMTDGRAQYLSVSVNGESVAPRQRIGSQAYAFLAYNSSQLGGYPPAHFATLEQLNQLTLEAGAGLTEAQVNALIDLRQYVTSTAVEALITARGYLSEEAITALINTLIDARGYVSEAAVIALIDAREYLSSAQITALVNQLIDARGYVTADTVNQLIDARNYVTADTVNQLIDARNYVTADTVNQLIDDRNYVTADTVNQLIDDRGYLTAAEVNNVVNTAVNTAVTNLTTTFNQQIEDLQDQITNNQNNITNIENNNTGAGFAEILGVSAITDARMTENGKQGLEAATEKCKTAFSNVSTAHMCSTDEIVRALSTGNFDASIDGTEVWTVPTHAVQTEPQTTTCANFLYNSGDIGSGTTMTVDTNFLSPGNGGGATGAVWRYTTRACNTTLPVMCCR